MAGSLCCLDHWRGLCVLPRRPACCFDHMRTTLTWTIRDCVRATCTGNMLHECECGAHVRALCDGNFARQNGYGPIAVSFCFRLDASRTARLQAVLPRRRAACETPCHLRVRVACMYVYVWAKTAPAGIEPATCAVTVSCVRGCTWLQSAGSSS